MKYTVGIILFARMSSSRLPGKMLRPIGPTSLLERVTRRAQLLERPLLLATSTDSSDDPLAAAAAELNLPVFRGSLDNVLSRACGAARHAGFDAFARLCGDRPFLPLADMRAGLAWMDMSLRDGRPIDLISSQLPSPVPPGLMTEIVRTQALLSLERQATTPAEREHVTTGFYGSPDLYQLVPLISPLQNCEPVHMSVDTAADLAVLSQVIDLRPDLAFCEQRAMDCVRTILSQQSPD